MFVFSDFSRQLFQHTSYNYLGIHISTKDNVYRYMQDVKCTFAFDQTHINQTHIYISSISASTSSKTHTHTHKYNFSQQNYNKVINEKQHEQDQKAIQKGE